MSVLINLLRCYEYCEKEKLVDVHKGKNTVLLPLYHSNINAAKKKNNILKVTLDENGYLLSAGFVGAGEVHIFPITEDSVARSSGIASHPLEDKMQYCISEIADADKFNAYMEEFNSFYEYVNNEEVKTFLTAIKHFLSNAQNYDKILEKLGLSRIRKAAFLRRIKKAEIGKKNEGEGEEKFVDEKGFAFEKTQQKTPYIAYKEEDFLNKKGDKVTYKFKDIFLCFEMKCAEGKSLNVDTFKELHEEFIRYIDEISKFKNNQETCNGNSDQRCNISGNYETITDKHRGIEGRPKIISAKTAKKENYFGRFNAISDIIKVGRKSSEKIHLMLKFLLENKNSHIKLAGELYLVNWFSGDIQNSIGFDISKAEFDDYMDDEMQTPVSEKNREIGRLFIKGSEKLNPSDKYYVMLVDKSSEGRISIKYYNEMQNSQLKENLEAWQKKCIWEKKKIKKNLYYPWVPTLKKILLVAYGIEKDGKLITRDKVKKENKEGFSKAQFQNLVMALIEGKSIPANIKKTLAQNIKNRQRYDKTWDDVLTVSLAVLSEGKKEDNKMREKDCQTRSYLFGRLLSVYDKLEYDVLKDKNKKQGSDESSAIRATNAERYWNAFVNKPYTMMETLERSTRYCVEYMKLNGLGGFFKTMDEAKDEILKLLDTEENRKKINAQLDSDFIFGYYAQRKEFFTKKEREVKEEDNE